MNTAEEIKLARPRQDNYLCVDIWTVHIIDTWMEQPSRLPHR